MVTADSVGGVLREQLCFTEWQMTNDSQQAPPPSVSVNQSVCALGCVLTQVVVFCDCSSGAGSGTLLGELVPKLHDARILLQHLGDLHLRRRTELLPLRANITHIGNISIRCAYVSPHTDISL